MRRDVELLDQRQGLLVDRLVVALHVLRERNHVLVLGLLQRLLGGLDVELASRIGDMRDLRIVRLGPLRRGDARGEQQCGECSGEFDD